MISRRLALRASLLTPALAASGGLAITSCARDAVPRRNFGISITGSRAEDVAMSSTVAARLGRQLRVLNFFVAWEWQTGYPLETVAAIRKTGAIPEITWEPWNPLAGVTQPKYALAAITSFASYVDQWAHSAAADGGPLVIRFAHEMNSDWYPWSAQSNGGSPRDYREAFRWVRSRFDLAGADNVRWIWCPNIDHQQRPDLITACFPGDDVVDIVAVDGYNRGEGSARTLFDETLGLLDRIAPSSPKWVNEIGCRPGDDQAQWITDAFLYFATTSVEAIVWFEIDASNTPDWRLLRTPETASAASKALVNW
ncbi:glycosyl hydrolase [Williamsia sp. MIQD14]|uniref:glycosyl hydrolase n=1 Tax=Williamsia sp. MIQD14 TaxID=3425703 RepID=UPI003DA04B3E